MTSAASPTSAGPPSEAPPPRSAALPAPPRFVRALVWGNALAWLLIAALAAASLWHSRAGHLERAAVAAHNAAQALQQSVAAEIDQVDLLLRAVILGIEREGVAGTDEPAALQKVIETRRVLLPQIQVLYATDAQGIVRYGDALDAAQPVDVRQRDYFIRARDDPAAGLVVSQPVVGQVSKRRVVVFARRINAPDGGFAGVVFISISTQRFGELLARVNLGREGSAALRASNHELVARASPQPAPDDTGRTRISAQLQDLLLAQPGGGAFVATSTSDGVHRSSAFLPVARYPFFVVAGLGTREFLAPWHAELRIVVALAASIMLVLGLSSWLLARAWQRESRGAVEREQQARRSQALLRTASDGIHVLDREGRLVECSDAFAHMLGYPREALQGMPAWQWEATVPTAHVQAWCRDTQGEERFRTRHRRADGTLIDVEVTSTIVHVEGTDLIYCASRDLTERVRLERRLERQTRNLAAMTAISDDFTVVLSETGEILVANRAFEDYWKLAPGGAFGHTIVSLYGQSFFDDVILPKLRRALAGETVRLRTVHELEGRGPRTYDATYQPVRNAQGVIDAVVFTSHDIDDLVKSRDLLSHTVDELQRSNESLEQFVRVTSHDLREPLNTIAQFVGLIEEAGPLPEPLGRYFGFVRRGTQRMRTMLDDLLRFVRLEGVDVGPLDPQDLDTIVREVLASLATQIEASGARVRCAPLPAVRGHHGLLVLLFQNLLSNAVKFTPPGVPPQVSITARHDGEVVTVWVEDRGIGIAAADIDRLFEPFRRLHRRQAYEGTGLGLATCKRIMMALGGQIDIQSEPGAWTRVQVTLPTA
ncbi:MAG: PAS domain-containing protein [Rhizobacter sp.]|nr:PAS domain-containing protein [Rhizobacter sp.]